MGFQNNGHVGTRKGLSKGAETVAKPRLNTLGAPCGLLTSARGAAQ